MACSFVLFVECGFSAPRKYLIKTGILSDVIQAEGPGITRGKKKN